VDGRVYNPITGEGIGGVTVKLYRNKIDSKDLLGSDSKTLKIVTTDVNGYYKVEYLASPFNQAFVQINYGGYYPLGWVENKSLGSNGVKKGKRNHLDYVMVPYGQLHWHIKNINCEGSTDTLWYKIKYQYDSDFLSLWSFPITGCSDIVGNGSDKMEMGNHIIYMRIKRPSGTIYKYDTIFVNESGITNFDLLY
jgi:hypothetical protein